MQLPTHRIKYAISDQKRHLPREEGRKKKMDTMRRAERVKLALRSEYDKRINLQTTYPKVKPTMHCLHDHPRDCRGNCS